MQKRSVCVVVYLYALKADAPGEVIKFAGFITVKLTADANKFASAQKMISYIASIRKGICLNVILKT